MCLKYTKKISHEALEFKLGEHETFDDQLIMRADMHGGQFLCLPHPIHGKSSFGPALIPRLGNLFFTCNLLAYGLSHCNATPLSIKPLKNTRLFDYRR